MVFGRVCHEVVHKRNSDASQRQGNNLNMGASDLDFMPPSTKMVQ